MISRIKANWNMYFMTSLFFMFMSLINTFLEKMDISMMYFAMAIVFMGIGELINKIKKLDKGVGGI